MQIRKLIERRLRRAGGGVTIRAEFSFELELDDVNEPVAIGD